MRVVNKEDRPKSSDQLFVVKLNGAKTRTLDKLYKKLSKKLHLPEYFGNNLDALADCLSDLSWLEQKRVEMYIRNQEDFLSEEDEETRMSVAEILKESMEYQIEEGRSFEVVSVVVA